MEGGKGTCNPTSLLHFCTPSTHSHLTNYIAYSFISLVSLSLHPNGSPTGSGICLFCSQLFPFSAHCVCPMNVTSVCLPPSQTSPALSLGRKLMLIWAVAAALPWPPQAPARSQTGPAQVLPREGENRLLPVGDGELGGDLWVGPRKQPV